MVVFRVDTYISFRYGSRSSLPAASTFGNRMPSHPLWFRSWGLWHDVLKSRGKSLQAISHGVERASMVGLALQGRLLWGTALSRCSNMCNK